jgi:heterodisulfide reductase subunit B
MTPIHGFFPGCAYRSAAGYRESVEAVNTRLDIHLQALDDWNCCGATAAFSLDEADGLALCARLFALAQKQGFARIVTVCNACYTTLLKAKKHLEKDRQKFAAVCKRLAGQGLEISGTLPDVSHYLDVLADTLAALPPTDTAGSVDALSAVGAYYGCQYSRPWSSGAPAQRPRILEEVLGRLGIETVDHSAGTLCCGASHAVPYADACGGMIRRIVGEIRAKGGGIITTICPMCQFNLDAGQRDRRQAPLPVTYFTQLIGLALGIAPEELGLNKLMIPLAVEKKQAS